MKKLSIRHSTSGICIIYGLRYIPIDYAHGSRFVVWCCGFVIPQKQRKHMTCVIILNNSLRETNRHHAYRSDMMVTFVQGLSNLGLWKKFAENLKIRIICVMEMYVTSTKDPLSGYIFLQPFFELIITDNIRCHQKSTLH